MRRGGGRLAIGLMILGSLMVLDGCDLGGGGPGLPRQQSAETYPGERHEVVGTIDVAEGGCVRVRLEDGLSYLVIWPATASQGRDDYVNLGWFQRDLGNGDRVRGEAALTPLAGLPHWADGYWHAALGWCAKDEDTDALVFDWARGVDE